ncbi:MAG: NAD(P)H-binding protein [Clostridiales bacterium]|nr:NAD(P)H-binding protein [Clostridiales bacterium]
MKVIVIGGTGFIGYYTVLEFLKKGHQVSTISLPDIPLGDWFPKDVDITYDNVFEMKKHELIEVLTGYDAIVYAVGPDDRAKPKGIAYTFFYDRLVTACIKVITAARDAGIKRCVVLNSYFATFDRLFPDRKLTKHHSYINCRVQQANDAIAEGKGLMDVMILELPYIFGTMPERVPLWKDILVKRLQQKKVIFYPKGGSNMIAVEHVAEAVVGATLHGKHGTKYPIGDENMSWKKMIQTMLDAMNMSKKKVITIPCSLAYLWGRKMKWQDKREGVESGLDPLHLFRDIMCQELYYDASISAEELGYKRGGIKASIQTTINACIRDM